MNKMDRKVLRLAFVIAVSLFVGTVFTGCNDGEDAYLLKRKTSMCRNRRVALRLLLINC